MEPGDIVDDQFELKQRLGDGAFGEVWLAHQRRLTRDVVLKFAFAEVLNQPGMIERFEDEARTLGRLEHPNIVHLIDAGRHAGRLFLVMQYASGGSLSAKAGQVPLAQLVEWMDQVCDALAYAHDHDVVHRDIKPENLLLTRFGHVQVADFGVAKTLASVASPGYRRGTVAGTPGYWAPEQEDGEEVDRRADLYALGATIYHLVTGVAPGGLRRKRRAEMLAKVADERLRGIVERLTEEERDARFGSAGEVKAALAEVLRPPVVAPPGPGDAGRLARWLASFGRAAAPPQPSLPVQGSPRPVPPAPPRVPPRVPLRVEVRLARGEVWAARVVPAGSFRMGSPDGVGARDEHPQRTVTLTAPFAVGEAPVTQAQWRAVVQAAQAAPWAASEPGVSVLNPSPSYFADGAEAPQRPVEQVSWLDAVAWCNALSRLTGRRPAYRPQGEAWTWDRAADGFRLPTEAEWEYVCRGGTTTAYSFGDDAAQLADHGWYDANSGSTTHPVRQKRPNPWGLYDVHGNVWEWCWDWYTDTYNAADTIDPAGPARGVARVLRGGCYGYSADWCRSAFRYWWLPDYRYQFQGLRVVLSPPPSGPGL